MRDMLPLDEKNGSIAYIRYESVKEAVSSREERKMTNKKLSVIEVFCNENDDGIYVPGMWENSFSIL